MFLTLKCVIRLRKELFAGFAKENLANDVMNTVILALG